MNKRIDGRVEIGHVHLTVSDLDRSIAFYSGVLGFEVTQRWGTQAALLGAGGYHHRIGLNTWERLGGTSPAPTTAGLYHFSIRYPDRATLGNAWRRLQEANVPLERASDHGISQALYLRDPDGHGLELYCERPRDEWPRSADGSVLLRSEPLNLDALLSEALVETDDRPADMTEGTRKRLGELRTDLLNLHKVLLDDTKAAYEMDRGRVGTNANLLQLVINDPWFAWLRSLSELIVRIDELLRKDAPASEADAGLLLGEVERLLTASESGEGFQKRYYEALQRQPAVVLAHADVRRTLRARRD